MSSQPISGSRQGMSSSVNPTSTIAGAPGAYNPSQTSGITGNTPTAGHSSVASSSTAAGLASGITNPTTRSADYPESARTRVPDTSTTASVPASAAPSATYNPRTVGADRDEPGMITKVLGAVGLGHSSKTDHNNTTTSAVTSDAHGVGSGPPAQYRRESIPTSAYPGGPSSPAAINAPIGGTRPVPTTTTGGTGVGSTVIGGHEYAPAHGTPGAVAQLANVAAGHSGQSKSATTVPATQPLTFHDLTTMPSGLGDKAPSSRDLGLTGAGTAAVGAGAASTALPHRTHQTGTSASPIDAVAAAPGRYAQQDYDPRAASNIPTGAAVGSHHDQPHHHTGRDTALAAGTGAAVAGAAAHATTDRHSERTTSADAHTGGPFFTTGASPLSQAARTDATGHVHEQPVVADTMQDAGTHDPEHHAKHGTTSGTAPTAPAGAGVMAGEDRGTHKLTDTKTGGALLTTGASPLSQAARTATTGEVHEEPQVPPSTTASIVNTERTEPTTSTASRSTAPISAAPITSTGPTTSTSHYTGRDAAFGAGAGVGAAIAADNALSGRHNELGPNVLARGQETATGIAGPRHTAGAAHDAVDPTVAREHARRLAEEETRRRHEREAAAGVSEDNFTGTGAFSHEKHPHGYNSTTPAVVSGTSTSTTTPHHHTGRDAALGAGAGTAAGVGASRLSSEHTARTYTDTHASHEQRKPSILKRIFKRRKNKDTGEDEEYSTDEEDHSHRGTTAAVGTAAHHHGHHETSVPIHHSDAKDRTVLGRTPATATTATTAASGHYPSHSTASTSHPATGAQPAIGGDGHIERLPDGRLVENITGMPYDPSKDPAAAARLQAMNRAGAVPGAALEGTGIKNVPTTEEVSGSTASASAGSNMINRPRGEGYTSK